MSWNHYDEDVVEKHNWGKDRMTDKDKMTLSTFKDFKEVPCPGHADFVAGNQDKARALLERLRLCDANSAQAYYGSRIFGEAADGIESQRKELEELRELCGELVVCIEAIREASPRIDRVGNDRTPRGLQVAAWGKTNDTIAKATEKLGVKAKERLK